MAHQVVCRTRVDEPGRVLEFTWSVGSSAFPTYALRDDLVEQFRENTKLARDRLFDLVNLYQPAAADRDLAALRRCCLELALSGRNLYNLIFAPEAQPKGVTKTIRRWLREITNRDEVQSLEVVSEGQPWFAPWNVVYDADPDEDLFLKADPQADGGVDLPSAALRPFWGLRYNLCGGLPVEPLRRNGLPSQPDVLFVIDTVVRDDLARHVDEAGVSQQAKLLEFIATCEKTKARVATSREELRKALKDRPHLIYWLGHANPTHLALGDDKVSLADLGNFLRDSGDDDEASPPGGLVFLNACQTATSPDRGLGSFLKAFHNANFSGIIATEERTLDNVASPFGLEVMKSFLNERKSIGEVLRRLRGRYAPLGLLYGTYCPPDLQLRSDPAPGAVETAGQVRLGGAIAGRTLGGGGGAALAERPAEAEAAGQGTAELLPLPDEPYLPLASYGPEHRALFAGRDADIERFARVLSRPDTRVLVLHGESGVGKSSFLNAGVIPYLDDVAVGYRFHGEDGKTLSALFVRATDDPAAQVAEALADFAARPYRFTTPAGDERAVDLAAVLAEALEIDGPVARGAVRAALLADPALLDRALGALASSVPFTLVLIVDQAEEMFTLANPDGSGLADRDQVLRMLSRVGEGRGDYKVIVSLRTEFYGRLIGSLRQGPTGATGVRDYLLADLERDDLIAFVTRPTVDHPIDHAREIPRDRYGFRYAEGVPEALASELLRAGRKDGVLPLAQVICSQLWERVQARGSGPSARVVTHDDLKELGGFAGALRRHVEAQIKIIIPARAPAGAWLFRTAKSILPGRFWTHETFKRLMTDLTLSQVDGTLTTALVSERDLASRYGRLEGIAFADILLRANANRLLRTTVRRGNDGVEERSISLGHDALARVAGPWRLELEQKAERVKWRKQAALLTAAAVLALICVGIWVRSEERDRDRRRATAQGVVNALTQARVFELENRLPEAIQLVTAARDRLDFAPPTDPLRVKADKQLQGYRDREQELRFVSALEEARLVGTEEMKSSDQGLIVSKGNGSAFRRVFLDNGFDVEGLSTDAAVRLLASRSPDVRTAAAMALDDWALQATYPADTTLRSIARQVDTDPLRKTIRTALAANQTEMLRNLARDVDPSSVPVVTLELLGFTLEQVHDTKDAITHLRRACRHHPNNFRLNLALGSALLASGSPTSSQEAISCFAAADALRPDQAGVQAQLARALRKAGRSAEAVATLDEAIRDCRENPDLYNVRGLALASLNEHNRAIEDYNQAIRLDPTFSGAFNNRGLSWQALKKHDTAIADFTAALRLDPGYSLACVNRGHARRGRGDLIGAIADYTEALRIDPRNSQTFFIRGWTHEARMEHDAAIADYDEALRLNPRYALAHNNRGLIWYSRGQHEKALADYEQAMRLAPRLTDPYINRGDIRRARNDFKGAIADYTEAIRLDSNNVLAYTHRAGARCDARDLDGAYADSTEAIRLDPRSALAHNHRAYVHLLRNECDGAIADYSEAIRLNPHYALAFENRGLSWATKGETDKAISDYDKAISAAPHFAWPYYRRGFARLKKKDRVGALNDFNEAVRLDPRFSFAYIARGDFRRDSKDTTGAIADYSEAIRLDPKLWGAYVARGRELASRRDHEKAVADYTEAIRLNPNDSNAHHWRGHSWEALKQYDKAAADFAESLRIDPRDMHILGDRATALNRQGLYRKAIEDLEKCLVFDPNQVYDLNLLAWIYATTPDPAFRNGKRAVELATHACEATAWKNASYVDTLAAAHAEEGDFVAARTRIAQALATLSPTNTSMRDHFRTRQLLYESFRPFRTPFIGDLPADPFAH